MSPKKQKEQKPATPAPFRNNPFATLKGIVAEATPAPDPVKKVATPKPEPAGEELFRQAMSGVRRLDDDATAASAKNVSRKKHGVAASRPQDLLTKPLAREEITARKTFLQEVEKLQLDVRFEDSLPDDELRPLNGNRLRQLKRGIIQLDRQLDLHGLTREEAVESLAPFLQAARTAGEKGVLVITGKGNHSAEGPVLQQVVAAWLRDQGRDLITEYAPAPQEMGGSGAFVIFLRPLDK
ncbi:MAG: Smr/MutS family protein [Trichlorobacter sp.]|uniref:Smr/MutS family protein n=1 Tax=Trichlorobacter sp. TaxID=2911007 RepID=UPI00255D2460|nr:Smr/MutS family protein [Trichlorobacter sp.]MDK9716392.1 Smr/MutS family protein [Trichlorobacter sp.]